MWHEQSAPAVILVCLYTRLGNFSGLFLSESHDARQCLKRDVSSLEHPYCRLAKKFRADEAVSQNSISVVSMLERSKAPWQSYGSRDEEGAPLIAKRPSLSFSV